ncbi:hypothetical protein JXD38_10885 [candidate division WOR-3 bacterium]|nr:hypothetical protein [candidate division WOR-3 bacterium]
MMRQYRRRGSCPGPVPLRKLVAVVFAVACMVGPTMAWTWDAASVRFVAPTQNNVDSGTVVTPSAVVRNLGDSTASFPVLFSITPDYLDTVDVVDLSPGDSVTVTFTDWTALQRGTTTAACSTALVADESTANDRISRDFSVRVRDVGVDQILAPVGIINLGLTVTPQAKVTNYGTSRASFWATFRIGDSYVDSSYVFRLSAGDSGVVEFADWTPDSLGTYAVSCTAAYSDDIVPANDLAQDSCTVQIVPEDAGVMRVVAPTGLVDSGAVFAPQAMVRNFGSNPISFPVIFTVGTYADTQQVTDLASLDSLLVTFADWTAEPLGMLTTRCSTALTGDPIPSNDEASDSVNVFIRNTDVGAVLFTAPADTVDSGAVVPVRAWVRNFGLAMQSFPVMARIGTTWYADTVQIDSLAAGDSVEVTFADYTVPFRGSITARCSTLLAGDQVVANNRALKTIFRRVTDVAATRIVGPVGSVDSGIVVPVEAMVRNRGNTPASFFALFTIGTTLVDIALVSDLGPLDSALVAFGDWMASPTGTFTTQCSTAMFGDQVPSNNAVYDSVQVVALGISGPDPLDGVPRTVTLSGSGPAAGRVAIQYGLPRSAVIRLEVFDACGRRVRVLASGISEPGYHDAAWNCTDEHGRVVAEGAYFVRLIADDVVLTSKVVKTE